MKGVQVDKDVAAELKQLRKVEREYECLKIEHGLLRAIDLTSKRKQTSSPSSSTAQRSSRSE